MTRRKDSYKTMTEALKQAIAESELSYKALEKATGVTRQSIMGFAKGERTLRLDIADKLARYFGLEVKKCKSQREDVKR